MGHPDDVDLVLADPHGLDDDHIHPHGVENVDHIAGRAGHPPQMAAGRQAPDKYPIILGMAVHPDPVPQDRPAGKRAARIDGHYPHPLIAAAIGCGQLVDQG